MHNTSELKACGLEQLARLPVTSHDQIDLIGECGVQVGDNLLLSVRHPAVGDFTILNLDGDGWQVVRWSGQGSSVGIVRGYLRT